LNRSLPILICTILFVSKGAGDAEGAGPRRGATCLEADGNLVAVGGHGGVDLYRAGKRRALGGKRNALALALEKGRLLEAGGRAGERGDVFSWDWKEGKLHWSAEPHSDLATSLAVKGGTVFSGSADRTIAILDLESGARRGTLAGHAGAVLALAASPGGEHLVSAGADRTLRVWEIGTGSLLRTIQSHNDAVTALSWSPDGGYLASGSADRTVRIWQPAIGRLVRIVRGHDTAVLCLAWHSSGLYTGSADGRIRRIDGGSDAILKTLEGHRDWVAALALRGDTLVSADWTGRVLLWKEEGPIEIR